MVLSHGRCFYFRDGVKSGCRVLSICIVDQLLIVSAWGLFALFRVKRVLFKVRSGLSQTKELLTLLLFSIGANILVPILMAIVLAILKLVVADIEGDSSLGGFLVVLVVAFIGVLFHRRKKKLSAKASLKKPNLDYLRSDFTFHELTDGEEPEIGTWYMLERWEQEVRLQILLRFTSERLGKNM